TRCLQVSSATVHSTVARSAAPSHLRGHEIVRRLGEPVSRYVPSAAVRASDIAADQGISPDGSDPSDTSTRQTPRTVSALSRESDDLTSSDGPAGDSVLTVACRVCGQPLDPIHAEDTHPGCDPS